MMKRQLGGMAAAGFLALLSGCADGVGATQGDVNQSIADHAAQPAAHHAKTIDASELTTGTLAAGRLPPITTAMIVPSGVDGGAMPHGCAFAVDASITATTFRQAVCPVGKHPIGGGCQSNVNSLEMSRWATLPAADSSPTAQSAWYCQWNAGDASYQAFALCCYF